MFHRVLVTGANGLLGQAVARDLAPRPEVDLLATGLDDRPRYAAGGGYTRLDVTDASAVRRLFEDFAPNAVVHLAALSKVEVCETDRDRCWAVNVDATETLLSACRASGTRMIFASTDFIFDGTEGPYSEDDRPDPVNFYGRSKLASENAVRGAGLARWAVVRTALGFGAPERLPRFNLATFLLDRLAEGQPVRVPQDQIRTPTYDADFADGIWRLLRFGKSGTFHLSGRERLRVVDFARRLARAFDFDPDLIRPVDTPELHPDTLRPLETGLLILKAESELGFKPRSLESAFADLAARLGLPAPERAR